MAAMLVLSLFALLSPHGGLASREPSAKVQVAFYSEALCGCIAASATLNATFMHAVGIMQIADFAFIPFGNACLLRPTHLRATGAACSSRLLRCCRLASPLTELTD